ncbi:hypothetical protein B5F07_21705, partial [Lachnoclostridium sp. An169]|uniref:Ig-like domain-containing protein n=1 Tax=Lachnoclostridium sp. An169 TaxID=1965569 RepID=UPI000B39EE0C
MGRKGMIFKRALGFFLGTALALQPAAVMAAEAEESGADGILFQDDFSGEELDPAWQLYSTGEYTLEQDTPGEGQVFHIRGTPWDGKASVMIGETGWVDYSVEMEFTLNEWTMEDAGMAAYDCVGIVGRKQESQWLCFYYRRADQELELNKNYGNAGHVLETADYEMIPGTEYKMKLEFAGTAVAAYIAEAGEDYGAAVLNYEDDGSSGPTLEYGGAGIEVGGADISVSRFTVNGTYRTIPVESVTLNKDNIELEAGGSFDLKAEVLPVTATDKSVLWSTDNEDVVSVDENGRVTALAEGTAVIRAASVQNPDKYAECAVEVWETLPCETFFYVSTEGSDDNDGSEAQPFATIEKARDTIRAMEEIPDGGVTVYIMPGEYNLQETLMFEPEDSGRKGSPVVYTAYDSSNKPVITSGQEITGWEPADENLPYTSEKAKGHIYVADIEKGWRFHDLYIDGVRQQVSRQTNSDSFKSWIKIDTAINDNADPVFDEEKGHKIYFGDNSLEGLPSNGDIEVNLMAVGFWNALAVLRDFDYEENSAYLNSYNPLYFMDGSIFDDSAGTYNIMNAYKYIDEPGEWCVDSENGKVYLWPEDEELDMQQIIAPKAYRIVEFNGDKEADGFENLVEYVTLKDLSFSYTDRLPEDQFPEDWVKRNCENPDAAIYMDGVQGCTVEGCVIKNTGTYGIALYHYAQNNRIAGNCITGTGSGGIEVFGYGAGTLDINKNNVISRNYISDLGLAPYMHAGAISLFGSNNNLIELNKIANVPYSSISIVGTNKEVMSGFSQEKIKHFGVDSYGNFFGQYGARYEELDPVRLELHPDGGDFTREEAKQFKHDGNNLVRHNITEEYMMKTDDGGCLYTWGCDNGNVFEENIIYKSESGHGWVYPLYMDDEVDGVRLEGNRIWAPQTSTVDKGTNEWIYNKSSSDMEKPPEGYEELYNTITAEAAAAGGWLTDPSKTVATSDVTVKLGEKTDLGEGQTAEGTVTWTSSDPSVVMVNAEGQAVGMAGGNALVKMLSDGVVQAKWNVTVTNNVALSRELTVSSHTDWATEQKECLVDGDESTKWCSATIKDGTPQWAVVDLGEARDITGWRVVHAAVEGADKVTYEFKLQYTEKETPDGAADGDWIDADSVTGNIDAVTERNLENTIHTRYVKLYVTEPVQLSQATKVTRIYELEVYGQDTPVSIGTVDAVTAPETLCVPKGTEFEDLALPKRVETVLEDGQRYQIPVTWNSEGYEADADGTYTLLGEFRYAESEMGLDNPMNLKPEIKVAVGTGKSVDKTLLQKTVEYALSLSTEGVTDTAKEYFEKVLAEAQRVLADENADADEVNTAWDSLL